MIMNLFKSTKEPVLTELTCDEPWPTVAQHLTEFYNSPTKEATPLFNLWQFKTVDYVPAPLGGISRCKDNALGSWGLVLDFDGYQQAEDGALQNTSIEEAQALFAPYEYVLYTTFRHLEDGVRNKFRVVLPFETLLPLAKFQAKRQGFLQRFPTVDKASFSASQVFYLHSAWNQQHAFACHHAGQFFDPSSIRSETPQPMIYSNKTLVSRPKKAYTAQVLASLSLIRGMHYDDAMRLANAIKGSGGEFADYHALSQIVFAYESSHRTKSATFLQSEFNRAYSDVTKDTVNKLLVQYGVAKLPVLCLP